MPHFDAEELLRLSARQDEERRRKKATEDAQKAYADAQQNAVEMARKRIGATLSRWGKLPKAELEEIWRYLDLLLGGTVGAQWLHDHPSVYSGDTDTVFHNRGGAYAAGWRPPCVECVEYGGKILYLTTDHLRSLIAQQYC